MSYDTRTDHIPTDQRLVSSFAHLAAIISMFVTAGWLPFVGPLVVWLLYKDKSRFVRQQAADAFNFNLAITVMTIVAWILVFTVVGIPVAIVLFIIAVVAEVWCSVRGALHTSQGRSYRYPFRISILH